MQRGRGAEDVEGNSKAESTRRGWRARDEGDGDGDGTIRSVAKANTAKRLAHPEARGRRAPWPPSATRADAPCRGRAAAAGTAGTCARQHAECECEGGCVCVCV